MQERNFALGVAYSKTEILQVALFGLVVAGAVEQLAGGYYLPRSSARSKN
jgi:hypothetical protein